MTAELKQLHQLIEKYKAKEAAGEADRILFGAREVHGLKVVTATLPDADAPSCAPWETVCATPPQCRCAALQRHGREITLLAVCGKEAVAAGIKAGDLINPWPPLSAAPVAANPTAPWAAARTVSKLDNALATVDDFIIEHIKK